MEQGNLSSARDILQRGVLAVRGKHEAAVPLWTAWGLLEERSGLTLTLILTLTLALTLILTLTLTLTRPSTRARAAGPACPP